MLGEQLVRLQMGCFKPVSRKQKAGSTKNGALPYGRASARSGGALPALQTYLRASFCRSIIHSGYITSGAVVRESLLDFFRTQLQVCRFQKRKSRLSGRDKSRPTKAVTSYRTPNSEIQAHSQTNLAWALGAR